MGKRYDKSLYRYVALDLPADVFTGCCMASNVSAISSDVRQENGRYRGVCKFIAEDLASRNTGMCFVLNATYILANHKTPVT